MFCFREKTEKTRWYRFPPCYLFLSNTFWLLNTKYIIKLMEIRMKMYLGLKLRYVLTMKLHVIYQWVVIYCSSVSWMLIFCLRRLWASTHAIVGFLFCFLKQQKNPLLVYFCSSLLYSYWILLKVTFFLCNLFFFSENFCCWRAQ